MKFDIRSFFVRFRYNIGWKLLSLAMAFVVWLVVVAYYNPETTNTIRDLPISIDAEQADLDAKGLIMVTELNRTVDVRLEGRRAQLALISKEKVSAAVDLATVTKPGEYALPVLVTVDGQSVQTISQSVQTVTLKFEKSISAQFTVEAAVKGKVADGYVLEKTVNPTIVKVSGPESVVGAIETVRAIAEQSQFKESGSYDCTMEYLDKNGEKLDDTYLTADTVKMNITILAEKTVPLQVEIVNSAGGNESGYLEPEIEPAEIMIAGDADAIAGINSISLGKIDVSLVTADYSADKELILPNGIRNVKNEQTAKVEIPLKGSVTKTFTVSGDRLVLENVPKGVKAAIQDTTREVSVRGLADEIGKLKASDLTLVVDCSNTTLSAGSNRLTAYVRFAGDTAVGAVGRYEITVTVS